ncbi:MULTISPECIES: restriction endonuclease subunit S [unclassified Vibrio]|uniref:restriction endonuclease subunit S n=1 Tax=unclassified Vibrio TaxID=2614977 RepID=UPI001482D7E8|nr:MULTISPECIES: restriction endonuclease subunit S [unclassified Vibrio]NNN43367.1 restriction endonuclease subunit S [Vibrio sp. 1-1(7)]NNN71191.1 restriction endonuclease subunit S [Vibrio sp. 12-2(3-a)]
MSFEQTPLNEFITLQRGFDLPKGDRAEGAVPVIASTGVGGFHNTAKVEAPGVVIGRSGSIGGGQYVQEPFWPLNTTLWVKDFKGHDPRYIYYLMRSIDFTKFNVGSGVPTLNRNHLSSLLVNEIGIDREKTIAKLLGDLDDKIALNTQTNQTLEQMAQAIFKSWFVDFDPVKAKMNSEQPEGMDAATASLFPEKLDSETGIPVGWKLSEIGDEVIVVGGGTPSKKNDDFWVDGNIHWTSPKDLSGVQDKVLLDTASKVTEAGLKKISSGLLPVDTVLLSSRAPVGYLALAKVPMAINQGYIAMKCEKQLPPEFVLQWCVHRMDEIKQRASGSTFAEISKKSFKPISVVVPSSEVLSVYRKVVKPLYDAITSNARQNEQLASLRDTLLPKLLSGQLDLERN